MILANPRATRIEGLPLKSQIQRACSQVLRGSPGLKIAPVTSRLEAKAPGKPLGLGAANP